MCACRRKVCIYVLKKENLVSTTTAHLFPDEISSSMCWFRVHTIGVLLKTTLYYKPHHPPNHTYTPTPTATNLMKLPVREQRAKEEGPSARTTKYTKLPYRGEIKYRSNCRGEIKRQLRVAWIVCMLNPAAHLFLGLQVL
jgi:hypothetical protein